MKGGGGCADLFHYLLAVSEAGHARSRLWLEAFSGPILLIDKDADVWKLRRDFG